MEKNSMYTQFEGGTGGLESFILSVEGGWNLSKQRQHDCRDPTFPRFPLYRNKTIIVIHFECCCCYTFEHPTGNKYCMTTAGYKLESGLVPLQEVTRSVC